MAKGHPESNRLLPSSASEGEPVAARGGSDVMAPLTPPSPSICVDSIAAAKKGDAEKSGGARSLTPEVECAPADSSTHQPEFQYSNEMDISFRPVAPVEIRVRNLSVSVDTGPQELQRRLLAKIGKGQQSRTSKTILDDISADMPTGSLTAIIGGSGSGKTSMLSVMADRVHGKSLKVSGTTSFNGLPHVSCIESAYVMQQDVLIPTLTVRETLRFSAELKLPATTSQFERRQVVEEVIMELGLKEAANTRVGNNAHKGCSGGEKRRTSLGVQLLANPSVLFLDEPTTGLDATSAFQLVRTLKNLARKGRTIVVTIHQPRSEIWSLFDRIILLTKGSPAFSGPASDCLKYFAGLGHELPPFVNPAEFLIDIVAIDSRTEELEEASTARVELLKAAWRNHEKSTLGASDKDAGLIETHPDTARKTWRQSALEFVRQTKVLTARTFLVTIRDPLGVFGSMIEAFSMAIVTGWIFLQLDGSVAGIRSRQGALYSAAALQGYLVLLYDTYRLTIEIQVFDRERSEGVVSISTFLLSRRLARLFIEDLPIPLIFSVIFYFMVGFRIEGGQFLTFFGVIVLEQYIAVTLATVCVAISRNFAGASLAANLVYTLQSLASGFFIQAESLPVYVQWTKWTAYCFYAFGALCGNEFSGHFYDCPAPGGAANPACRQYDGDFIMESLGLPSNWVARPIIALVGYVVAFYFGATLIFGFWRTEVRISRARESDSDGSAGKEKMVARSVGETRAVSIFLSKFALDIRKRKWWGGKEKEDKAILKPITAKFEPGILNVIMGPSGSGKTSLLNSMARRLKDDFTTNYRYSGSMLYNGAAPSDDVVQSIAAFVTQDDDALLSSLTVRETLRYAAGLRLPSWMTADEKNNRAESILLKMGLKDCADNLIGGELVKGISGGEKRRVTIATQVLTEPRVLLLDEPTSGLDAFTASSIINVLQGLADEGRTLVLTIHQSRSDLWQQFGNVTLLARGGNAVYSGPGNHMLEYFSSLGHDCPRTTNPADFALDLITVDLQHANREEASREKVRRLVDNWHSDSTVLDTTDRIATPAELGSLKRSVARFRTAAPILLRRSAVNIWRQPPLIIARIMQVVGLGIVLAFFFSPLKNDFASVQNRLGIIQELAPLYFVGMLQNVSIYPFERDVFYRENDDRAYGVEAFFLQYTLLELPFEIVSALLTAILVGLAVGLPRTAEVFFVIAFNTLCIVNCGESVGILFNTLFEHTGFAVNVTSVFLAVAQLMSGIMSLSIPAFLQAFNYLNPVKYSVGNLAVFTFRGQKFTCEDGQRLTSGRCPFETGEEVLVAFNLDKNEKVYLGSLFACVVVYRILAYVLLKAMRERWNVFFWRKSD